MFGHGMEKFIPTKKRAIWILAITTLGVVVIAAIKALPSWQTQSQLSTPPSINESSPSKNPTSSGFTKTFTMPSWDNGAPRLQVDFPSDFSMERRKGPDFEVFYFFDDVTKGGMGLYAGHHPSLRSRAAGVTGVQRHTSRMGDISVEWSRWSQDGKYRSETLVLGIYGQDAPLGYADLVLHIFMVALTEQDIARMEAAAATLRLEKAR
jgi:hypothetical protein